MLKDKTAQQQITFLCYEINRRICQMNYEKETELRQYLTDQVVVNKLVLCEGDEIRIADILDVNENCIYDILTENNLIS